MKSLRDRANVALGFTPRSRRPPISGGARPAARAPEGPQSNKALLASAGPPPSWKNPKDALVPWDRAGQRDPA